MLKSLSITRRILVGVLLAELVSTVVISLTSVFFEQHVHFQAFDVMLNGRAQSLLGAVGDADDAGDTLILDMQGITLPKNDLFDVEDSNGRILGRSPVWPPEITRTNVEAERRSGIYRTTINHTDYRFVELKAVRIVDPSEHGGITRQVTILYGSPTTHVWHEIAEAVRFYSILSLALLVFTAGLIAWFLRSALSPLRELASEASGVSATQWSFNPPETAKFTRELAPLTKAIETTLVGLERSFAQQRRFTGDAAHELKTGVAIIKSSLQLLAMRDRTAQDYRSGLEVCLADCARLEITVLEMLTLARVDYQLTHHVPPTDAELNIASCVDKSIRQFSSLAQLKEIAIVVVARTATARVRLSGEDGVLLCSNLLHNALQHSSPGSTVSIKLENMDGFVTMSIEDEGEGISEKILPHIFEPFFRADSSRDRKSGGTGLGLAICKAICDRAGGSIVIDSVVNKGTQVAVRLPSQVLISV